MPATEDRTKSESVPTHQQPAPPEPGRNWLAEVLSWLPVLAVAVLVGFIAYHGFPVRELVVVLLIAALLLSGQLRQTERYLGKSLVEFEKGFRGLDDDIEEAEVTPRITRRATVRYYSRMNPDRVYPLLVMLTRDQIARVCKKGTDQRESDPFAVDPDAPVEIEPVLPGCDCYPPKVVARLGEGDRTFTFRVVPHVLGQVDGAVVHVRQDHEKLAEIALDARVTKQTWVKLSGAAAFLLPGLSAVMKHFGLDFESQAEQGFSPYIALARLVFDRFSPYALAALLAAATAALWWLTRPRVRDVFHDIEKVSPTGHPVE